MQSSARRILPQKRKLVKRNQLRRCQATFTELGRNPENEPMIGGLLARTMPKPGEGDFLPEGGALALAYFRILEANADHTIELSPSIKPLGDAPLEGKTEPVQMTALPEGTFACFFYMH
ncbi:MAG: hypothetical protein IH937_15645 [Acidobacteria bacterium]|nr:hypothetical protein [Acidobacteriota bacterium]